MTLTKEQIEEIKTRYEKTKQTTIEELISTLEKLSDGANVHTINKSIFYLKYFSTHETERYVYNFDRLEDLKYEIILALEEKSFEKLSKHMRGWW